MARRPRGIVIAPNFSIGAVLMQRFAAAAAPHLDAAEVVELHHDGKADAPSGTALATARGIAAARSGPPRPAPGGDDDHPGARGTDVEGSASTASDSPGSWPIRRSSSGGRGRPSTIRHDTTDRAAFMPGVLLAIRAVASRPGLTVGLDALLD